MGLWSSNERARYSVGGSNDFSLTFRVERSRMKSKVKTAFRYGKEWAKGILFRAISKTLQIKETRL
jgi:hypothetical protein